MSRFDGLTTRRRMKKLRLDEISLVDSPAHKPARVAILKRDDVSIDTISIPDNNTMTIEELQKRAERAEAVCALPDAQRAHFNTLSVADQDAFLAAPNRDSLIKADPVIYTDLDGNEYRKSVDNTVLRLVKSNDELRKRAAESEARATRAEFVKRAGDELPHLTGTVEAKADLLAAVATLPADRQAAALEILKSKDAGMARAFETIGATGEASVSVDDGEAKLNEIAKSIRTARPELSPEKAYVAALETSEGQAILKNIRGFN